MIQIFRDIKVTTNGQKLINITDNIINFVDESKIIDGIINLSILHTSASLIVQENVICLHILKQRLLTLT